jgi:hypothetical protein
MVFLRIRHSVLCKADDIVYRVARFSKPGVLPNDVSFQKK